MGIKREVFLSDSCEIFICPVCEDVAMDPVLASCCEAAFCSTCFNDKMASDTDSCAGCNQQVSYGIKLTRLQKQLKQVYERLQLKCGDCDEELTIGIMNSHDCPAKVFNCIKCGFHDRVPRGEKHDCINFLKNENESLRSEMALIKEESIRRETELVEEKMALRAMFEDFMRMNGSIVAEQDGTINVRLNGADNLAHFRPRTGVNVPGGLNVPSGLNVSIRPNEVVFNETETKASPEIREKLVESINQIVKSPGAKLYHSHILMEVRNLIRIKTGGHWFVFEEGRMDHMQYGFNPIPSSHCSFTYDGHHYIAFEVRKSRIFEKTRVSKSDLNVSSVPKSDLNVPKNSCFTFLEEYTFATKEVREKVESAIMMTMTMGGNILQSESFEAIMNESSWNESNRNESSWNESNRNESSWNESNRNESSWNESNRNESSWNESNRNESSWNESKKSDWRLLLKDSAEKIGSRSYSFDPKTFCTFTFQGCLYITFKRVKGQARQPAREHPDVEIVRRKMRKLSRTDFFGTHRSSLRAETRRTNSRKGSKEEEEEKEDFQSVSSACSLGLRSSPNVSSNQRKATPEVVFNRKETFAPLKIKKEISAVFKNLAQNGRNFANYQLVKSELEKKLPGNWFIQLRERLSSILENVSLKDQIVCETFCSFTFGGNHFIAFRREDGAGYGILMGKILQFGLGIEDGATGGEPKLKPESGLNVSRFGNIVDSSDEEEEIFGAQNMVAF